MLSEDAAAIVISGRRGSRRRLTKKRVERAPVPAKPGFIWDAEPVGFGLKLTPNGARIYVLQYRFEGRSRRYVIGNHGSPWTVETARQEALRLLGRIQAGHDPQKEKTGARRDMSVSELCDLYLSEGLRAAKPLSVQSAETDIRNHIKPILGARLAASITSEDVERMMFAIAEGRTKLRRRTGRRRGLSRVRGGKGAANSAVAVLSAALTFGIRRGVRPDNPALGIRKFPEKKMDRFLSPAELARLGEVLAAAEALGVESPYAIAALRLLILTGCRKNEIVKAERTWVDMTHRCLRLPDSKTGAKVVHLGEAAMEVIRSVPPLEGNPYLLPGRGAAVPIADLQSSWERIRAAAGLKDVRIHDLRHAFASFGAATGESLLVIGALLGHRVATTTERYTHLADTPLRGAADRISGEVARLMGLSLPAERATLLRCATPAEPPPGAQGVLGEVIQTRWLDTPAAAALLGNTIGTLQTWRWMGVGPPFRRIGRRIVYALGDLDAWRREHGQASSTLGASTANVVRLTDHPARRNRPSAAS